MAWFGMDNHTAELNFKIERLQGECKLLKEQNRLLENRMMNMITGRKRLEEESPVQQDADPIATYDFNERVEREVDKRMAAKHRVDNHAAWWDNVTNGQEVEYKIISENGEINTLATIIEHLATNVYEQRARISALEGSAVNVPSIMGYMKDGELTEIKRVTKATRKAPYVRKHSTRRMK